MSGCKCVLVDKACPACLEKLAKAADLYLKAALEFFAKIEWIGKAHAPDCKECVVRHADDVGELFVTRALGLLKEPLRGELYEKLVVALVAYGAPSLEKTRKAHEAITPMVGKERSLDGLLKALYGGA